MLKIFSTIILFAIATTALAKNCPGKFINPISDVCWRCVFPISIGKMTVNMKGREDTENPEFPICLCPRGPIPVFPGLAIGFWEPVRLVDVTRKPYCMIGLGGISFGGNASVGHGYHSRLSDAKRGSNKSFYQVHWYIYPLVSWLQLLADFMCMEDMDVDVAYMTELDPLWNDDELSLVLNAEASLFGGKIAQLACAADCVAASANLPLNILFWCAGCQGSMYPFTGTVMGHTGGVQASMLIAQRMMAKLHRQLLLPGTSGKQALCKKYIAPIIIKDQYKLQMVYPRPTATDGPGYKCCMPLGRTDVFFGSTREYPEVGEDYSYLVWRKRNCCVL